MLAGVLYGAAHGRVGSAPPPWSPEWSVCLTGLGSSAPSCVPSTGDDGFAEDGTHGTVSEMPLSCADVCLERTDQRRTFLTTVDSGSVGDHRLALRRRQS
ncbi:hypothetical protein SGFS_063890 [Streptomyces graminofaciens]|uniref:Secreted protein n=1 Tax=Streptomyces graminofaciens TaxID=68212 RepID=A0ABM7FFV6_9ACTN|nr:hypothetical protein SGFS_063890 [Streptomyces graminofaciens]